MTGDINNCAALRRSTRVRIGVLEWLLTHHGKELCTRTKPASAVVNIVYAVELNCCCFGGDVAVAENTSAIDLRERLLIMVPDDEHIAAK